MIFRKRDPLREWAYGDQKPVYVKLPKGHPDRDAEDMAHWWQTLLVEIAGGLVLIAVVGGVAWFAQPLGPLLPRFLSWLSGN